jgi:hypothetical protein
MFRRVISCGPMGAKADGSKSQRVKRTSEQRESRRKKVLGAWALENHVGLDCLDLGQQWIVFAAIELVTFLSRVPALARVVGYFLAHCGMDLGSQVIAAVVGVSDRAVRQAKAHTPEQMLHSVRHPIGGHRKAKLKAEHAGIVAKYLVEHPRSRVKELLDFIATKIGPTLDRLTLRRYLKRYGLGCLRGPEIGAPAPLFSAERSTEELFS